MSDSLPSVADCIGNAGLDDTIPLGLKRASRRLPELFAAGGCLFEFSAQSIALLAKLLGAELKKL